MTQHFKVACSKRMLRALTITALACMLDNPTAASAQALPYVAVLPEILRTLAQKLKQDLQDGAILLADLHAMQLRLALAGVPMEEAAASISILEQHPERERNEPKFTAGLVPDADQVIEELRKPNRALALKYADQLAIEVHAQHELYLRSAATSATTANQISQSYGDLTARLNECLLHGDIAAAVVLAAEVQDAEDMLVAKNVPSTMRGGGIFDVNDALGRAAFLRQDYLAAGDYLLKATDTPGNPVLRSFGPDFWLARALLQAGRKDVVLIFLERCKAFWPKPALDEWIAVLKDGGIPNFSYHVRSREPILMY